MVPAVGEAADVGVIVTDVTVAVGALIIVTVAVADLLGSAVLVALTVAIPGVAGAV
jgi:hypothetical protein